MAQNAINNTIVNANFTVPNGTITSSGDITTSAGNLVSTLGSVSANTTVTAGTGLTVTTGNADILAGNVSVGTAAPANPARIAVEESVAGTTGISVQNTLVNVAAASVAQFITEPAGGDAYSNYVINGGQNWAVGLDNSDSDGFKITTGISPSAGTEVFNATTAGTVTMNGGPVNIGTDNAANAITIGTGTTARLINIGLSAAAHVVNVGVNNGASSLGLNAGTGNMQLTSGGTIVLNSAGTTTINSTGGTLSIGNNANAFGINIGTGAAARTITIGNTTGATAVNINTGTSGTTHTTTNGIYTLATGTGTISISGDAAATTVNLGTGGAAKTITLGNTTAGTSLAHRYATTHTITASTGLVQNITANGEITQPLQPAFLAIGTNESNVTGNGAIHQIGSVAAMTEIYDQNSDFVTSGTFTAPVTGRYHFSAAVRLVGLVSSTGSQTRLNTSNRLYVIEQKVPDNGTTWATGGSTYADMDASDTCVFQIQVSGETGDTVDVNGDGSTGLVYFGGKLVA